MRALILALTLVGLAVAQQMGIGSVVGPLIVGGRSFDTQDHTTVVAFISARCPVSNAFNDRMSALYRDYSSKGVEFLFFNANANETEKEIADHAKSAGFPFEVYRDNGNEMADRFGAMATPEMFLIDSNGTLQYHGYIDDAQNPARAKVHGLRDALDAVLAGKEVARPETKSFGCTIKRVRRTTE